jgi:hypothetical protein
VSDADNNANDSSYARFDVQAPVADSLAIIVDLPSSLDDSNSSGSSIDSVAPLASDPIDVTVDVWSPRLRIRHCSSAFSHMVGTTPEGKDLLDWIVEPTNFQGWIQQFVNETIHRPPLGAGFDSIGKFHIKAPSMPQGVMFQSRHTTINVDTWNDQSSGVGTESEDEVVQMRFGKVKRKHCTDSGGHLRPIQSRGTSTRTASFDGVQVIGNLLSI